MNQILIVILVPSFLTFWTVTVFFYTPSCFRLRAMIDLIDETGELKDKKIKWSIGYNIHTLDNWLIEVPTSDKYLKYNLVKLTVDKVKSYRTILGILIGILIICTLILLANSK